MQAMFTPKTAKAQTKAAESPTSKLAPQRSILTAEHEADPENTTARKSTRGVAWDFSKIPIFSPDRTSRPQASSPLTDLPLLPGTIQPKLVVGQANDSLEHEADRVADQVMRMPVVEFSPAPASPQITRKCEKCEEEDKTKTLRPRRDPADETATYQAPPVVASVLCSPGQPLERGARAFMEPRFGHSFADIRVHADAAAGESARAIGALAYASGTHIVFAPGQYAPGSDHGRQLLAHELAHTVQQAAPDAGLAPVVRRKDGPAAPSASADDERANDPNFLMCLALCELGIPPSLWRTVVNDMLSVVSQEYRDNLGDMRGSQEFESWRAAFTVMSTFNKFKLVIGFLGESRIGLLTIKRPAAQAIRRAALARLAERGLKTATLEVASQIIRKVAIAIEVAIAAGCTVYCGATALANTLLDFSSTVLSAVTSFVNAASQIGDALGQAIARPFLVARASMDSANWNLSALPRRSRAHMQAIGLAFRLAVTPDSFLASMGRPLSSYNIPQILVELAQDINATLQSSGGFAQLVTFTADFIGGLTPLQFVDILKDYRLLSFVQNPEVLADQQQAQPLPLSQGQPPPQ